MNTPNTKRNLKRTKSQNYSIKNSSLISDDKSINLTIREYINKKLSNLKNSDSKSLSKNTTKQRFLPTGLTEVHTMPIRGIARGVDLFRSHIILIMVIAHTSS